MKKILAIGVLALGMMACNDTGDRQHNMETVTDQGADGTINADSTGNSVIDAYRDDTGESGHTTDTSVINKSTNNIKRQ